MTITLPFVLAGNTPSLTLCYQMGIRSCWRFPYEEARHFRPVMSGGVAQLRNFTVGAKELIVVDPYFVKPRRGMDTERHVRLIADTTDLHSGHLNRLSVVNSWWHHDSDVVFALSAECARYGCELGYKQTNDIHDRVLAKDKKEALAVGTSLNSVGSRLAFALRLPHEDLEYLLELLHRRNLV